MSVPPRIEYDKANDYYKLLKVDTQVGDTQLKKSYFKLAMKHHPDKSTGNEPLFKKINHAYDILKDKNLRTKYNELRDEAITGKIPCLVYLCRQKEARSICQS